MRHNVQFELNVNDLSPDSLAKLSEEVKEAQENYRRDLFLLKDWAEHIAKPYSEDNLTRAKQIRSVLGCSFNRACYLAAELRSK